MSLIEIGKKVPAVVRACRGKRAKWKDCDVNSRSSLKSSLNLPPLWVLFWVAFQGLLDMLKGTFCGAEFPQIDMFKFDV